MPLSEVEFARGWGADALVQLPAAARPLIPDASREFLVRAGLPALVRYIPGGTEGVITFCRLGSGVAPVLGEKTMGPPLPAEWSDYWIVGDEFFCNGAVWWCVHGPTGRVDRIDIEIAPPVEFVNSSVAHLASAFLAAAAWSAQCDRAAAEWPAEVYRFKRELAELDPQCMQSARHFWPRYLDFIRDEGFHIAKFDRGSRAEGEQAFRAGPW